MSEGLLIAVEGIDGAGVTTQSENLKRRLEDHLRSATDDEADGPHTHLTKEPTDGPAGGQIRMALAERLELDPETLALFFATDRRDHAETEIRPLLAEGYVVVVDRYHLSSYAYQLDGVGGDLAWLREINAKSPDPDLTLVLDVPVETSRRRRADRLAEELFEDSETLTAVRENYVDIAERLQADGETVAIVSAEGGEEEVLDRLWEHVTDLLEETGFADGA